MKKDTINLNVFVYGTLRVGEHNFKRHFIGEFSPDIIHENAYVKGYTIKGVIPLVGRLYVCPKGMVPYAVKTSFTTRVKGNLFQFFDRDRNKLLELLKSMDTFEGHPYFYKRKMEDVFYTDDNSVNYKKIKGYMYEYQERNFDA